MRAVAIAGLHKRLDGSEANRLRAHGLRRCFARSGLSPANRAVLPDRHQDAAIAIDELESVGPAAAMHDRNAVGKRVRHGDDAQPTHAGALRQRAVGGNRHRDAASIDPHLDAASWSAGDHKHVAGERHERRSRARKPRCAEREALGVRLHVELGPSIGATTQLDVLREFIARHSRQRLAERTREGQHAAKVEQFAGLALGEAAGASRASVATASDLEHELRTRHHARGERERALVPRDDRHGRSVRLHLPHLIHAFAGRVARSAPGVDDAFVHVPAVVGADERHIETELAHEPHQLAEVRRTDIRVERVPVILEPDRDDRTLGAAAVARCLQVGRLLRHSPPEPGNSLHEAGVRLANAIGGELADPGGNSARRERPADARPDAEDDLEAGGAGGGHEAAHIK